MTDEIVLTKKQKEVLDYIRKYSDPNDLTENKIVNAFKGGTTDDTSTKRGKYARMTVLSIIDYLEKYNFIKIDEINTQYHIIRPNNDHLLNRLENELEEFEDKYFILTERLKNIVKSTQSNKRRENNIELAYYFYLLFQHLVGTYVMNMLVRWPYETKYKDEKMLGSLFITVFKRLQKIYTSRKLLISPSEEISTIPTLGQNLFVLDKEIIENMLRLCKKNDIQQETEKVLDMLWKISKQFFPFARPKFEKGLQPDGEHKADNRIPPDDWRELVDYHNLNIK
ncbi:MAG: hypothetical protein ACR2F1_12100 [Nitrososphaeraceae archaeon]